MRRIIMLAGLAAGAVAALPTASWASVNLINGQGATAPCIGVGPVGGPVAETCAKGFEQGGFIRDEQVGVSGLTIGDDGVVTAVAAGSPAAETGILVGDVIDRVNGVPVRPTPGQMAEMQSFGPRGQAVRLTVRRGSSSVDVSLVRSPADAPGAPASTSPLIAIRPMVNWRGRFVPCMGVGPLGLATIGWCQNHFKPYGYVNVSDLGSTGFEPDLARGDAAAIASVAPDSPAAKAGLQPGDEIVAVDGKPLSANLREPADEALFGKAGDTLHVRVRRGGAEHEFTLTLAAKGRG